MAHIIGDIIRQPVPFLRWAGGKRWFLKHLSVVKGLKINNYYEPFLGGGSVFFNLNNYNKAILSDLNQELIETYQCVRDKPLDVITKLKMFKNSELDYYNIRNTIFNKDSERAARFIYLNKTSFNGIYRVNSSGRFNVPYGKRKEIDIVDEANLLAVSSKLHNTVIRASDFSNILSEIQKGDFIFLDPPYTVAHENNGFIQYNQKIFSLDDQKRLSEFVKAIVNKGAYYILTNAKHDAILEIYKDIDCPISLSRASTVGGVGARRTPFNEYIFSNCINQLKFI